MKRALIGVLGGLAATPLVFGMTLLGTYSPAWLAPALITFVVSVPAAFMAISIFDQRR